MKKKWMLVVLLALVVGGILAGCQRNDGQNGAWDFYAYVSESSS